MDLPDHHLQVGVLVYNESVVATQLQQVLTKPVHKQVALKAKSMQELHTGGYKEMVVYLC